MKFILLLLALPLMNQKCNKNKDTIPTCIQQKIEQIKKEPKWNPPAEVNEYSYEGKRVYLFSSPCCDQYNNLYDKDCNLICAASGGYTGKGDGKCMDFFEKAKHVKLIWSDENKKGLWRKPKPLISLFLPSLALSRSGNSGIFSDYMNHP